jgi:hypothetical protein
MARPSIFISSTYYDLKHIRSSLEQFILSLGYDTILSEKGNIAYSSIKSLDESCYKQAQNCDIFVVVIGGRYGSEVSSTRKADDKKEFYDAYDSVTKREFDNAYSSEIPVYILIDKSVFSEYETFKRNIDNESINYAHVDSVNIFKFIDMVLSKPKNNPIFQFEMESEIEGWLKEQWAGLFKDLLSERLENKKILKLSDKVTELENINTTLKHYMEAIIEKVSSGDQSVKDVISEEEKRLEDKRETDKLMHISIFSNLEVEGVSIEDIKNLYRNAESIDDIAREIESATEGKYTALKIIKHWKEKGEIVDKVNEIRSILKLSNLTFE